MPAGVPVGTLAIGRAGAVNAGLLAAAVVALGRPDVAEKLTAWRRARTEAVPDRPDGEG
jgi:5-(carboxyamino)imidazole ribonucleotide mutase